MALFSKLKGFISITFSCVILCVISQDTPAKDPNADHIHFYFYPDPSNSSVRKEINSTDLQSIADARIVPYTGAKFIVHGTKGSCNKTDFPMPAISAYLKQKETWKEFYNVFCVEYTDFTIKGNKLVPPGNEQGARYLINLVGSETAKLIQILYRYGFIENLRDVHIIGHSLGALIASGIGRNVQEINNYTRKVGRVSGLDPGNLFGFDELDLDIMLDPCDGHFVEVYHTDAGRLGLKGKIGRVDFYPDGGAEQKLCQNLPDVGDQLLEETIGLCSHLIVGMYWSNSISNKTILACKATSWKEYLELKAKDICNDPVVFGEGTPLSAHGKYYLDYPQPKA